MRPTQIDHVGIAVADLEAAVERYRTTLGLEPAHRERMDDQGVEEVLFEVGSSFVQLLGALGLMEADPLLIQAEQKLLNQADELVVLADASKFERRSSLILCGLDRIATVITDERVDDRAAAMLEAAGVALIVTPAAARVAG